MRKEPIQSRPPSDHDDLEDQNREQQRTEHDVEKRPRAPTISRVLDPVLHAEVRETHPPDEYRDREDRVADGSMREGRSFGLEERDPYLPASPRTSSPPGR